MVEKIRCNKLHFQVNMHSRSSCYLYCALFLGNRGGETMKFSDKKIDMNLVV